MDFSELVAPLAIVGALVLCSAFFSGTEVAMFSLRRVDREQMGRSGRKGDTLVTRLLSRPRRLIATLLIGNEVVNISVSATMAGVGDQLFYGHAEATVALLTTVVTLPLLLFFGEITPKTIAIKTSTTWARTAARPLWLFGALVTPLRVVVQFLATYVIKPFGGARPPVDKGLGEAEFRALVDAGSAEGELDARERRLIHKVFEFGDKTVSQVMCPASEVFALAHNLPLSKVISEISARGYSRIPIYRGSRDDIIGVLYAKDLVVHSTGLTAPRRLHELVHKPLFVPPKMAVEQLFTMFKRTKTHMALVVNEYGKLRGVVTMEDLLEELFGPIRDEKEVRLEGDAEPAEEVSRSATLRAETNPPVAQPPAEDQP